MKKLLTILFSLTLLIPALAQSSETFTTKEGAINGYDPVAYFTVGAPVKGKKEFSTSWNGVQWLFSSKENLDTFKASPEKFAPQYGGYCAYGVSQGHKSPTEPDAFTIVDDKLYLNYNQKVKTIWTKDQGGFIQKANGNWPGLKGQ